MFDRCYGCFMPIREGDKTCPHCGYSLEKKEDSINVLPQGTVLDQKYVIGRTLGEGGFGITYLAWDKNMEVKIAIKEFYPSSLIARDITSERGCKVYTVSGERVSDYESGLQRYVKEAATLSKFYNLPGIVSVKDFFYENDTAYIVMEYVEGISLKEYLKQNGNRISADEMKRIMEPVLRSLSVIHDNKLLHRDISPDNIMIAKDGTVKLIDFGAARYFDGDDDKSKTVMLKHGYAPIEQYSRKGDQGVWTDIYGLCSTMYRMLTGIVPEDAPGRVKQDDVKPIRSLVKGVPRHIAEAVEKGLSVDKENRQQSVAELYYDLYKSKRDVKEDRKDKAYRAVNKILTRIAVVMVFLAVAVVLLAVNSDRIAEFKNKALLVFGDAEESSTQTESEQETGTRNAGGSTQSADAEESKQATEPAQTATPAQPTEPTQPTQTQDDSSATQPERGTNPLLDMRPAESVEEDILEHTVVVARDGRLNVSNTSKTVGEILDAYSDSEGMWTAYEDTEGQLFAYYQGEKNGEAFIIEFQVYADDTFKLTGAAKNGAMLTEYATFFQSILTEVGV